MGAAWRAWRRRRAAWRRPASMVVSPPGPRRRRWAPRRPRDRWRSIVTSSRRCGRGRDLHRRTHRRAPSPPRSPPGPHPRQGLKRSARCRAETIPSASASRCLIHRHQRVIAQHLGMCRAAPWALQRHLPSVGRGANSHARAKLGRLVELAHIRRTSSMQQPPTSIAQHLAARRRSRRTVSSTIASKPSLCITAARQQQPSVDQTSRRTPLQPIDPTRFTVVLEPPLTNSIDVRRPFWWTRQPQKPHRVGGWLRARANRRQPTHKEPAPKAT